MTVHPDDRDLFIAGYFRDRCEAGDRLDPSTGKIMNVKPDKGYPHQPGSSNFEGGAAYEAYCDEMESRAMQPDKRATDTGIIRSIGMHEDDQGRQVLRAIVDFYDGDAPDVTFGVVFDRVPVRIVRAHDEQAP